MTICKHRSASDDEGVALVTVMGAVGVISVLVFAALSLASSSLKSSTDHTRFEAALAVAEAGVDQMLAHVSNAYNGTPSADYMPASGCQMAAPTSTDVATPDAERTWARNQLTSLPSTCLTTTAAGQFVASRAPGRQAVYSMSWFPSRAATGAKSRLLKAEYVFAPYKPGNAILTGGSIDLSGSITVNAFDPLLPANIHTNSSVTAWNNSLEVKGSITSTGTLPGTSCPSNKVTGTCLAGEPPQAIPAVNPRAIYNQHAMITDQWFDLCYSGGVASARKPASTGPCTGSLITNVGGSGNPLEFNGWSHKVENGVSLWTLASGSSSYPGAYYVYGGSAQIGGNGNSKEDRFVTVMAEALQTGGTAATCGKLGGDITWKLFQLRPYLQGLILAAEGSLLGGANADAGVGLFTAGNKVDLKTSSSTIQGAIVAANTCPAAGTNELQGITVSYDETVESPVNDLIRTTLWLEYQIG